MSNTVEREMIADLVDCSMVEFIHLIKDVEDLDTRNGMLNILRAEYQQMELALTDLRTLINDKDSFTPEEKELHVNLFLKMSDIEERCRLLVIEIGGIENEFVEGSYISNIVETK